MTNEAALRQRGALLGNDDDFVVVACTKCRAQYLYNEETLDLYVDPVGRQEELTPLRHQD